MIANTAFVKAYARPLFETTPHLQYLQKAFEGGFTVLMPEQKDSYIINKMISLGNLANHLYNL